MTLVILIRLLDEVSMGIYFIALIMVHLFILVSDFGLDLALVKKYPEENDTGKASLLKTTVAIRFLICVVVSSIFLAIVGADSIPMLREMSDFTVPIIILFWLHSFRSLLLRVLQAEKLFTVFAGTQALAAILKVIFVAALISMASVSIDQVILAECVAFLASIAYAVIRLKKQVGQAFSAAMGGGRELLSFGFPLYLNSLVNVGNERVSHYIVAVLGGPLAVAYFSVGERLADAGRRMFVSFTNIYLPAQTSYFAQSQRDAAIEMTNKSLVWITSIIGVGTIAFAVVREFVIELLFTAKYLVVANVAVVFFMILMLRSIQVLMGYFSVASGHNFVPVKVSLISSVFSVVLTFSLFHYYGYEGAAVAMLLTQALMIALYYKSLRQSDMRLNIRPVLLILAIFVAALAWAIYFGATLLLAALAVPAFVVFVLLLVPGLLDDLKLAAERARLILQPK